MTPSTIEVDARSCPRCQAPIAADWRFCGRCAANLEPRSDPAPEASSLADPAGSDTAPEPLCATAPDQDVTVPETTASIDPEPQAGAATDVPIGDASSRAFSSRIIWVSVVCLLTVVLGATSAVGWMGKHQATEQLASARARLGETNAELASTKGDLISTRDELEKEQAELHTALEELDEARAELKRTEGSLSQAHNRMDLQANHIETLKTCLGGVTRALEYSAYTDYVSAVAELEAVQISCDRASSMM